MSSIRLAASDRARRAATVIFFAAALLLHLHRCVSLFQPAGSLFSDQPLLTDDNSMHSYYTSLGAQLIARTGQPYGYVPHEMAGHPKTPIYDAGIIPVERLMATFAFLPPFLVYKLFVLLSMTAIALASLFSLRLLGLRGLGWVFGWTLVMFHYWWGQGLVFTMGGMNTWLLAASLALLLVATTAHLVSRWSWPLAGLAGALMCLAPYVHPIATVPVVLSAALLIALRTQDRLRTLAFVAGCGALALLVNGSWLWLTHSHSHIGTPLGELLGAAESPLSLFRQAWDDLVLSPGLSKTVNRVSVVLFNVWIVGGGIAALVWLRRRRDPRFVPLLVPFVVLGFLTYFTRDIAALQNIQPWRLRFLFVVVASLAAALLCAEGLRAGGYRRWLAAGTGLFGCLYFVAFDARPDVPPLRVGFGEVHRSWMTAINQMVDRSGRILAEDGRGYHGVGLAALHLGTDAQWIGGPYRGAYITYHRVHFLAGRLSDRPIESYDAGELAAFFTRYNVRWVMAWSPASKQSFDRHSTLLRRRQELSGVAFYEVTGPSPGFFERGSGDLEVDLDSLRIRNARPVGGSLVLRYHHYDHLVVEGAQGLRSSLVPGDPVGFIEVVNPTADVRIRSSHGLP